MIDRILVNREECEVRVAFLEKDVLVELHTEKFDEQTIVNNIYRGRVQDVVPGLQAAFVDVGLGRNMFLHFMDIRPESLVLSQDDQFEAMRKASEITMPGRIERKGRRPRMDPSQPQAESPVKRGDEIIVQVVKDEIGGKAPRVTTNLSLAGRYVVLLPFPSQDGGVSRKIAMGQDRFRLKKLLASLRTSEHSFIVRTAGMGQSEEAIEKDAELLERLWSSILDRYKALGGPGLLNNDHNLLARLVRDAFPPDFQEALCDSHADTEDVRHLLAEHMPGMEGRVKEWRGVENIFESFGVEKQIAKAMTRKVWLPSGGYLIIDEDEALTAIDVNTGRFTGRKEQEKTSLKTNMEACEAIAQQIRLRDIGGIIVCDFIDMVNRSHQEKVSEELRRCLKNDRAKTAIGKIGDFGVLMLTRKRQRMSLQNQLFNECPYCKGTGLVLQPDEIFRKLKYDLRRLIKEQENLGGILVAAHPHFVAELTSRFSRAMEEIGGELEIFYKANVDLHMEDFQIVPIRKTEGDIVRLPGARLDETARVLPIVDASDLALTGAVAAGARVTASQPAVYELDATPEIIEVDAPEAPPAAASPAAGEQEKTGRRRRRRGRRGGQGRDDASRQSQTAAAGGLVEVDDDEDEAAEEVAVASDAPKNTEEGALPGETAEETRERRKRESSSERRARRRRSRDRRRDDGDEKQDGAEETPAAVAAPVVVAAPEPPKPAEPLKLTMVAKSRHADLLADVLEEIEQQVASLTAPTAAPAPEPAPVVEKAEEAPRPAARRRTPKAKKEVASVEAAAEAPAAEPVAEEKPKKRAAKKPAAAKAPKAVKAQKEEAVAAEKPVRKTTAKKASTTRAPKAKTKAAADAAEVKEAAPARKKAAAKPKTTRKKAEPAKEA